MANVVELETGLEGIGAFYTHAKSEAGIFLRIDAASFENVGMDHAGSGDFVPTGFTEFAASTVTESTSEVDFKRRFGKLKMERTQSGFGVGAIKVAGEIVNDAFEVLNVDAFVYHQSFELMKHGGVSEVLLAAVAFGDIDHADGRSFDPLHFPYLAITGVRG